MAPRHRAPSPAGRAPRRPRRSGCAQRPAGVARSAPTRPWRPAQPRRPRLSQATGRLPPRLDVRCTHRPGDLRSRAACASRSCPAALPPRLPLGRPQRAAPATPPAPAGPRCHQRSTCVAHTAPAAATCAAAPPTPPARARPRRRHGSIHVAPSAPPQPRQPAHLARKPVRDDPTGLHRGVSEHHLRSIPDARLSHRPETSTSAEAPR